MKTVVNLAVAGMCGGLAWSSVIYVADFITNGKFTWQPADLVYPVGICMIAAALVGSTLALLLSVRPVNAALHFPKLRIVSAITGLIIAAIVLVLSPGAIFSGIFSGVIVALTHSYISNR